MKAFLNLGPNVEENPSGENYWGENSNCESFVGDLVSVLLPKVKLCSFYIVDHLFDGGGGWFSLWRKIPYWQRFDYIHLDACASVPELASNDQVTSDIGQTDVDAFKMASDHFRVGGVRFVDMSEILAILNILNGGNSKCKMEWLLIYSIYKNSYVWILKN